MGRKEGLLCARTHVYICNLCILCVRMHTYVYMHVYTMFSNVSTRGETPLSDFWVLFHATPSNVRQSSCIH